MKLKNSSARIFIFAMFPFLLAGCKTPSTEALVPPVILLPSVEHPRSGCVTISTVTSDAQIVYTTDGSDPAWSNGTITNGKLYDGGFYLVEGHNEIRAIAARADLGVSSVIIETIDAPAEVYCAGFYRNGAEDLACYWDNQTRIELSGSPSMANQIVKYDGSIYVVGKIALGSLTVACMWKDGALRFIDTSVSSMSYFSEASRICFSGTDCYILGHFNRGSGLSSGSCYWKNGVMTEIGADNAVAMAIDAGNLYIPVYSVNGSYIFSPGGNIPIGSFSPADIDIAGGILYVSGSSDGHPAYWSQGSVTVLSPYWGVASSIKVRDGDVFVGGYVDPGAASMYPAVWKNSELHLWTQHQDSVNSLFLRNCLYAGGCIHIDEKQTACYWWDDRLFKLDCNGEGRVNSIFAEY